MPKKRKKPKWLKAVKSVASIAGAMAQGGPAAAAAEAAKQQYRHQQRRKKGKKRRGGLPVVTTSDPGRFQLPGGGNPFLGGSPFGTGLVPTTGMTIPGVSDLPMSPDIIGRILEWLQGQSQQHGFPSPTEVGGNIGEALRNALTGQPPATTGTGSGTFIPHGRLGGDLASLMAMGGQPVVKAPTTVINRPPRGYVMVNLPVPMAGFPAGTRLAMFRPLATRLGLYRRPAKPPIKAGEWKQLKTAARVSKKAKAIAQAAGHKVVRKGTAVGGAAKKCGPARKK